jgi:hypothetical protein
MTRLTAYVLSSLLAATAVASPVPKDDKMPPPTAKELDASRDNLQQIGLALLNYHDAWQRMPQDIVDKNGKPLLSWRVLIVGELVSDSDLYKQFKLDEAWDGPNNKKLIEKIPKVYAPIRVKAEKGHTYYRGFSGGDEANRPVFEPGAKVKLTGISDGTSNTAWVVEAGESVVWTKPADLPFDVKKELPKLGGLFDGEFHVLMCDGSVRRAKKDFDKDTFKKMVTRAGGEVYDQDAVFIKPMK